MRTLFSTEETDARNGFRLWREATRERFVPTEQSKLGDGPFAGMLEAADVGGLLITRSTFGAQKTEVTSTTIRRHSKQGTLAVTVKLAGMSVSRQNDQESIQQVGDLVVLDSTRPAVLVSAVPTRSLLIELPRERLERMLGSARLYTALTVGGDQAGTSLVTTFFNELVRVHGQLDPDTAARMASIGVDLIVAGIAERLARDVPKPLHGTVVVQRAKAHVESNLGDPTLDPPQLAAAVGVSLRRLQELFHERGRHVSDWIWQRRLEVAAERLTGRGYAHLPIGMLAYGCGFASQAHFARRFKDRYGVSPSEYRQMAVRRVTVAD